MPRKKGKSRGRQTQQTAEQSRCSEGRRPDCRDPDGTTISSRDAARAADPVLPPTPVKMTGSDTDDFGAGPSGVYQQPVPLASAKPEHVLKAVDEAVTRTRCLDLTSRTESKSKMMARPGYGSNGRPIHLIANYFLLRYNGDMKIYHYDVDIEIDNTVKGKEKVGEAADDSSLPTGEGKSIIRDQTTFRGDLKKGVMPKEHEEKRVPGKQRCKELFSEILSSAELEEYHPVYDGQKNVFTAKEFPFKKKKTFPISLVEYGKRKTYNIVIKPCIKDDGSNIIHVSQLSNMYEGLTSEVPQDVLMVFDTVMNHRVPPWLQFHVGRSFFRADQTPDKLAPRVQLFSGYNQSVHLTERGPALVVNFTPKAFHEPGSVIYYINGVLDLDIVKRPRLDWNQVKRLNGRLENVVVKVTHLSYPREYTIKEITYESAREYRTKIDGETKTIASYFQTKYKPLKYPFLPCLKMKRKPNACHTNEVVLPIEVCQIIPHQIVKGKVDNDLERYIKSSSAVPPDGRFNQIYRLMDDVREFSGNSMRSFDLRTDKDFMRLTGRVIAAPSLEYKGTGRGPSQVVPDPKGVWRMDGKQFVKAAGECSWIIVSFARERCDKKTLEKHWETLFRFADILCATARKADLHLEPPKHVQICDPDDTSTDDVLKWAQTKDVTFVLVVLPGKNANDVYKEVKNFADNQLGLVTQCIKDQVMKKFDLTSVKDPSVRIKLERMANQIASNILLKINAKAGGVNHTIVQKHELFKGRTMIFGADAVHFPRGRNYPSIFALVGSIAADDVPSQYKVTCRTQENEVDSKISQELALELDEMVKLILREYRNENKGLRPPEKVLFFRDGVSDTQFLAVLDREVPMILRAFHDEFDGFVPKLTFIVVQKRHQTRFIPRNPKEGVGKMGNVPPGTTVDTDVVHPVYFDFFVCSHEGIQGTSTPAHYTVLHDDNRFKVDQLQKLCYQLCHTYTRCNRSISIPAPVMYADLACTRAKTYADHYIALKEQQDKLKDMTIRREFPKEAVEAINAMGKNISGMFYV